VSLQCVGGIYVTAHVMWLATHTLEALGVFWLLEMRELETHGACGVRFRAAFRSKQAEIWQRGLHSFC